MPGTFALQSSCPPSEDEVGWSAGISWAGNAPEGSAASARSTSELREKNAELCQRLLQSEANRLQLEQQFQAALVSLQQEHRLLLQKVCDQSPSERTFPHVTTSSV